MKNIRERRAARRQLAAHVREGVDSFTFVMLYAGITLLIAVILNVL